MAMRKWVLTLTRVVTLGTVDTVPFVSGDFVKFLTGSPGRGVRQLAQKLVEKLVKFCAI